ncbi:MAG: hypothetical protein HQM12_05950 [SAR324 cluster bacterium]|nr:hypothetical protein [SAR324 cluster bacterium]
MQRLSHLMQILRRFWNAITFFFQRNHPLQSGHGWIERYLRFRLQNPFDDHFFENSQDNWLPFDDFLYAVVQENGIFYGCPILDESLSQTVHSLHFPVEDSGSLFIYLETLFFVPMRESLVIQPKQPYENRMAHILVKILRFYLPKEKNMMIHKDLPVSRLFDHAECQRMLHLLEDTLINKVHIQDPRLSQIGSLQNSFIFPKLFYFFRWYTANLLTEQDGEKDLRKTLDEEFDFRLQVILVFGALIWSDGYLADVEMNVMEQYIKQADFPDELQELMLERIQEPMGLDDLHFKIKAMPLKKYLIERTILLSLIDNQQVTQERMMIERIAGMLEMSSDELEIMYDSVGAFFARESHRFVFLKNNPMVSQLQQRFQNKIMNQIKDNLDKIMIEIKETQELYSLLVKATSEPLTDEEVVKVRLQLLDILKTIPAIAIFLLPAGAVVLAILIKVLPFNILPSAFNNDSSIKNKLA